MIQKKFNEISQNLKNVADSLYNNRTRRDYHEKQKKRVSKKLNQEDQQETEDKVGRGRLLINNLN